MLQLIRDGRTGAGQSPDALLQQAGQQAARKLDCRHRQSGNRHRLGADPGGNMAESEVEFWPTQAEQKQDEEADRAKERTRQAAWNAYQAARVPFERAHALFRLGELYDRAKERNRPSPPSAKSWSWRTTPRSPSVIRSWPTPAPSDQGRRG